MICQRGNTYKCLALTSISRPVVVPLDMGIVPFSLLSVRLIHERLDKLPMEGGIGPLKLLEFRNLRRMAIKKLQTFRTIGHYMELHHKTNNLIDFFGQKFKWRSKKLINFEPIKRLDIHQNFKILPKITAPPEILLNPELDQRNCNQPAVCVQQKA